MSNFREVKLQITYVLYPILLHPLYKNTKIWISWIAKKSHCAAAAQMANSKWQNWKPMETSTCVMNACRNGGQAQPKLNRNSNAMPIEKAILATKTFCVCNQALHFRLFRGRGNDRRCQTAPEKTETNEITYT